MHKHRRDNAPPLAAVQYGTGIVRSPEHQLIGSGTPSAYPVRQHRKKYGAVDAYKHIGCRSRGPERPSPSLHRLRSRNVARSRMKNFRFRAGSHAEGPGSRGWRGNAAHITTLLHRLHDVTHNKRTPNQCKSPHKFRRAFRCSLFFGLRILRPARRANPFNEDRQGVEL